MEVCYLLLHGDLPNAQELDTFESTITNAHHGARTAAELLPRLPARRAPHGDHGRRRRRAVGLLSRLHRHQRSAPAPDRLASADRQDADHRGDGLQVLDRPALRVSAQRPELCRELPAHDLLGAGRGIRGQPGGRARDGPHLDPPCGPRAERVDLHRALGRLFRRQSLRLRRGGHRIAVGPGAWRRQRGRAQHADRDRHKDRCRSSSRRRRTRTTPSA